MHPIDKLKDLLLLCLLLILLLLLLLLLLLNSNFLHFIWFSLLALLLLLWNANAGLIVADQRTDYKSLIVGSWDGGVATIPLSIDQLGNQGIIIYLKAKQIQLKLNFLRTDQ